MPAVLSAALGIGEALQIGHVCQGRIEICPAIRSDRGLQQVNYPTKVYGANMGPIWGRQDPGGPHVGPKNLVIWVGALREPKSSIQLHPPAFRIIKKGL